MLAHRRWESLDRADHGWLRAKYHFQVNAATFRRENLLQFQCSRFRRPAGKAFFLQSGQPCIALLLGDNILTVTSRDAANNTATQATTVATLADIQVTKADSPDPVIAGQNLTYTITVTNAGPSDAQNVQFFDSVPGGTTFVSEMQTSGPTFTPVKPGTGPTSGVTG